MGAHRWTRDVSFGPQFSSFSSMTPQSEGVDVSLIIHRPVQLESTLHLLGTYAKYVDIVNASRGFDLIKGFVRHGARLAASGIAARH